MAVLTIEKNTFPDTSYETSMHIKLSVPCQKITVYTADIKKLMLVLQQERSIRSSPNEARKASVFQFLEDLS